MNDINKRIAELSPAKRALLEQRLKQKTVNANPHPTISPRANNEEAPLSFAQTRMWLLDLLEPGNPTYNRPSNIRLFGQINVAVLELCLNEIVRRHEVLRANFSAVDGKPVQVINPSLTLTLPILDISNLSSLDQQAELENIATKEAQQPFNLAEEPLLRVKLLYLKDGEYVLLLNIHHIIFDGWSFDVFLRELAALYTAFSSNKPSPLPELPIQYTDFAHWQRQRLSGEVLESQLSYWKKQLGGSLPVLQLPTDYPRPPVQTYRGAYQSLELPQNLVSALKSVAVQSGVTLFMTLLAAFKILLYRYSGQEDIIVGTPIAGRNQIETEGLIGLFVNSLAIRTNLSANLTFQQLLSKVYEVTLGAYTHQDSPFEKMVEELHPERSLSHTPIFQVWFNMLNFAESKLELSALKVEPISRPGTNSKFDLTLYIQENNKTIYLQLVYNTALFSSERMVEMLAQYEYLLKQISEKPEQKITYYSLVTPKAKFLLPSPNQVLNSQWSTSVHTLFTQQARRVPKNLAVVDTQVTWSYAELEESTNQLANYLLENGIDKGDVVAVYGQRSSWLVVAVLGILKAGAAFVILDPAYPATRLIDCLRVASPRGWLQIEAGAELPNALTEFISNSSCRCYLRLFQPSILANYSTHNPEIKIDPDDLAYVAFTSGSTGKPQGILGIHKPLSHFLQWHCQAFGLNQSDQFSLLSGLSHDPLLRDIFTPLCLGATLRIPQQQDIETPGQLAVWMQQQKVTIAHLTPAMGQLLTETTSTVTHLTQLRYVFFGGDSLTRHHVTKIKSLAPIATCVNFYGATETPQAMGYFIVPNQEDDLKNGHSTTVKDNLPLGKGIEDVQLLILNSTQHLAGIGEVGEIYVRTPYLASGYKDNEQLTQERFIINPFTNTNSDRLYKTGDLARYLPDGNIEFLGRIDNQVKIRGFRIELGEIEAAIARSAVPSAIALHRSIQQTVVTARVDDSGDKRLVAYIVPHPEQKPTTDQLRHFLKQQLPEYMVPSAFVFLDTLPLTPNGKIDRRALPDPDSVRPNLEETFVAPRTDIEQQIADIWTSLLKWEKVGIHDNFFTLGGHSLLATQIISRLRQAFGIELPLHTLFAAPTVAELTNHIQTMRWATQNTQDDTIGNYAEGEL